MSFHISQFYTMLKHVFSPNGADTQNIFIFENTSFHLVELTHRTPEHFYAKIENSFMRQLHRIRFLTCRRVKRRVFAGAFRASDSWGVFSCDTSFHPEHFYIRKHVFSPGGAAEPPPKTRLFTRRQVRNLIRWS